MELWKSFKAKVDEEDATEEEDYEEEDEDEDEEGEEYTFQTSSCGTSWEGGGSNAVAGTRKRNRANGKIDNYMYWEKGWQWSLVFSFIIA